MHRYHRGLPENTVVQIFYPNNDTTRPDISTRFLGVRLDERPIVNPDNIEENRSSFCRHSTVTHYNLTLEWGSASDSEPIHSEGWNVDCSIQPGLAADLIVDSTSSSELFSFEYVRRNYAFAESVGIHGTYRVEISARVSRSNVSVHLGIYSAAARLGDLSATGYVELIVDGQPYDQRVPLTSNLKNQYLINPDSNVIFMEADGVLQMPENGNVQLKVFLAPVLDTGAGIAPLGLPSEEIFDIGRF